MRDKYVFVLFMMFLGCGTFLAYKGKVEPQLILTPIVTGFLGLLASTRSVSNENLELKERIRKSGAPPVNTEIVVSEGEEKT